MSINNNPNESKLDKVPEPLMTEPSSGNIPPKPRRGSKLLAVLLGFLLVIVFIVLGSFIGYRAAINTRQAHSAEQIAYEAATQFQLAQVDIDNERYEIAQQRLEYIIKLDPKFPGAADKLAEVMVRQATKATPTPIPPTPTPVPTSTPDLRPIEEMFNSIEAYLAAGDWDNAISQIEAIRTADIEYRAVDVDGMYYIALRARGIRKILQEGNLEGGIYDITMVEKFGPLDRDADGYRNMARSYLFGASFWKADWAKVVQYLGESYQSYPSLMDANRITVAERYRIALKSYAEQLRAEEKICEARDQYAAYLSLGDDPNVAPLATQVQLECQPPAPTTVPATPTLPVTVTPTMPGPAVTNTAPPAPEPTATTAAPPPAEPTATTAPPPPENTPEPSVTP